MFEVKSCDVPGVIDEFLSSRRLEDELLASRLDLLNKVKTVTLEETSLSDHVTRFAGDAASTQEGFFLGAVPIEHVAEAKKACEVWKLELNKCREYLRELQESLRTIEEQLSSARLKSGSIFQSLIVGAIEEFKGRFDREAMWKRGTIEDIHWRRRVFLGLSGGIQTMNGDTPHHREVQLQYLLALRAFFSGEPIQVRVVRGFRLGTFQENRVFNRSEALVNVPEHLTFQEALIEFLNGRLAIAQE